MVVCLPVWPQEPFILDTDTDSFIDALRRFIARRGRPEVMRSDNGTNFHGGERELRDVLSEWNQQRLTSFMSQREIKWFFNPPTASHMGGVWERIVQSVKKILKPWCQSKLSMMNHFLP